MKSPSKVAALAVAALAGVGMLARLLAAETASSTTARSTLASPASSPGSDAAAYEAFAARVKQFEKANPEHRRHRRASTSGRHRPSPRSSPAAPCPTSSTCRSPTRKTLLENGQLADITAEVKAAAYADKFNPNILDVAQDADGNIYGFPYGPYAMGLSLQPRAVQAGRARPRQAADDVGRGARGRQDHLREARQGRLHADDDRATPAAGSSPPTTYARGGRTRDRQRRRQVHVDRRQPGHQGRAAVPARPALGRQLDGQQLPARLGRHQPGVRRRQDRHVHRAVPTSHLARAVGQRRTRRTTASRSCPLDGEDAGVLGGGNVAVVSPKPSTADARPPPSSGSTATTCRSCSTRTPAVRPTPRRSPTSNQAVGTPVLPVFDQATLRPVTRPGSSDVRQRAARPM